MCSHRPGGWYIVALSQRSASPSCGFRNKSYQYRRFVQGIGLSSFGVAYPSIRMLRTPREGGVL
ncbi:MAG TPA: hypothetical protein VNQ55_06580 [Parapedobacter sp.]|nr:hypothetical protein [Parapedobacter sp.]